MGRAVHPPLTGGYLDRDGAARADERALDAAWAETATRVIRVRGGSVALAARDAAAAVLDTIPATSERTDSHIYLGRADGAPVFAHMLDDSAPEGPQPPAGWATPFEVGALLSPVQGELLAAALAVTAWHATSGFSPRDGSPLSPANGGWTATDPHGGEHFPRTDPVIIVRVEHDERLLLGSNALWESGRFSLLAGFIDAGESAEDAVAREVWEESGARLDRIRYIASQPWPFPRSLMLGFHAHLADGADPAALHPDPTELSELRWFTRDELRNPPAGISLPRPMSIARWLIDQWVADGRGVPGE